MVLSALCLVLLLVPAHCEFSLDGYWTSWKTEFNKTYSSTREEVCRRAVWKKNVQDVMKHNEAASAGRRSYTMGINHLSDMSAEEVNAQLNGLIEERPALHEVNHTFSFLSGSLPPPRMDWTEKGLVTPVRNQGPCGSCWAFSAVGALEGQMKKKTGRLVPLSPQNLVDCSVTVGNHGCRGGYLSKSFTYIIRNKGIDSDSFYPYEHRDGTCRYAVKGKAGYCSGFQILPRNELVMMHAVATVGPISVGINAKLASFHRYKSGIYDDPACDPRSVNHAVLVVGYGQDKGQDYWLIKNSWGSAWGENGFVRMARNKNQCGIANFAIFPTI
ncbi:cathepsin S, ortholog 1 [Colossoma macropomum]|uniref:cathepsin S, ortholog 1 n=1 Tax=Colossoma macropomum TaxID=42526 RepID=UPI001864ECDF|nr:cathepsin S, ortholog 1 [Colossoma macropomum]XP_036433806.1 cathepsin S, ortholog 1 [Colossoma macropomum]